MRYMFFALFVLSFPLQVFGVSSSHEDEKKALQIIQKKATKEGRCNSREVTKMPLFN